MPPRPGHIPHAGERSALQKMSSIDGLPVEKLHPAGRQMVAAMMAKGWIKRRSDDRGRAIYCITETGQEALMAPIPNNR
jgi:hypothetical protein